MKNIIQLFDRENVKSVVTKSERIEIAEKKFLAASAELDSAFKALSKRFDLIEHDIASIDDAETRSRLTQSARQSQEKLLSALIKLTLEIKKLVDCGAT